MINAGDWLSAAGTELAAKISGQEGGTPITGMILHVNTGGEWRLIDNECYGYLVPALHPAVTQVYGQFLDSGWWGVALAEAGQTIASIPGNLAQGIQEGTVEWSEKAEDLRRGATAIGVPLQAADFIFNDLTKTWLGFNGALVDLFTFGALSALDRYAETGSSVEAFRATVPGQFGRLVELTLDPHVNKEERAKFFGKIIAYVAVILAAKAASVVIARVAPKLYAWVFEKPSRALLLQKTKTLLSKITGYGKIAAPGLYAAELVEKLFVKIAGAGSGAEDTAIGQALDDFAELYNTYVDVYGEEFAKSKAQELLNYLDDQLRLRKEFVDQIQGRVKEKLGEDAANTLKKVAEPYGHTSLTELSNIFKTLNALERADLKLREIKILSETTLISDFVQNLQTKLAQVPDETALGVVSKVADIVHGLSDNGVSLLEIREILASVWTQIDNQQIDINTILTTLEQTYQKYLNELCATNGGSRIYIIDSRGAIAIWKGTLEKVWKINIEQRQVVKLQMRSIDRDGGEMTVYAGYDGAEQLHTKVTGGNPGENLEILDVEPFSIEQFADQIRDFTMKRPEGDLPLRYDSSTLETMIIRGGTVELTFTGRTGGKQETHTVKAEVLDYFARAGEAYIELKIGYMAHNTDVLRIYRNGRGENRLILHAGGEWRAIYIEADDLFARCAYEHAGRIQVSRIYISDAVTTLGKITDLYQLSSTKEQFAAGKYKAYRMHGKILGDKELEIIRKEGKEYNNWRGRIGCEVVVKTLIEKLGFPEENIIVKKLEESGPDILVTDNDGNEITVQVKLTTSHKYLGNRFGEAIEDLEKDLRTGEYPLGGYAFAVFADRHTGELIVEWVKIDQSMLEN